MCVAVAHSFTRVYKGIVCNVTEKKMHKDLGEMCDKDSSDTEYVAKVSSREDCRGKWTLYIVLSSSMTCYN